MKVAGGVMTTIEYNFERNCEEFEYEKLLEIEVF
jgi:hypothetical protein